MSGTSRGRRALGVGIALLLVVCAFGIPGAASAYTDSDKDGLPNKFERHKTHTNPHRKDTDRDGTPRRRTRIPTATASGTATSSSPARTRARRTPTATARRTAPRTPTSDGLTQRPRAGRAHPPAQGRHRRRRDPRRPRGSRPRRPVEHHRVPRRHRARATPTRDNDGRRDGNEGTRDDGLSNGVEQRVGTNPGLKDTDGDGKPDGREDPDADGLMTLDGGRRATSIPRTPTRTTTGRSTATRRVGVVDAPVIQGAPDCTVFPADNVWNAARRRARRRPRTARR